MAKTNEHIVILLDDIRIRKFASSAWKRMQSHTRHLQGGSTVASSAELLGMMMPPCGHLVEFCLFGFTYIEFNFHKVHKVHVTLLYFVRNYGVAN